LVELIAVIVVLAVLSGVAIPKFANISDQATAVAIARDFRVISNAGWAYVRDTGSWAPDAWHAFPPEFAPYFSSQQQQINIGTPLAKDTIYDWNGPPYVLPTGLLYNGPGFSIQPNDGVGNHRSITAREWSIVQRMDAIIDGGDHNTGRIRWGFYAYNLP
jgi:type II secretory pathway pseudopilin PulG